MAEARDLENRARAGRDYTEWQGWTKPTVVQVWLYYTANVVDMERCLHVHWVVVKEMYIHITIKLKNRRT